MRYRAWADLVGINNTVTRNIDVQIVNGFLDFLDLKPNIDKIWAENKNNISKKRNFVGILKTSTEDFDKAIRIETSEKPYDDSEVTGVDNNVGELPAFYYDELVRASMTTKMNRRIREIKLTYVSKSREEVEGIINRARAMVQQNQTAYGVNLEYKYHIPQLFKILLYRIYQLKDLEKDNVDFAQYISSTFQRDYDFANTVKMNPVESEISIMERQLNTIVYIQDMYSIELEEDTERQTYGFTMSMLMYYNRPIGIVAEYYQLVYNKELDSMFINFNKTLPFPAKAGYDPYYIRNLMEFNLKRGLCYLTYPAGTNDLIDIIVPPWLKRVIVISIVVDPNDPTNVLNLDDIPFLNFKDCFKNCLLKHPDDGISRLGNGLLYFSLYKNGIKQPDGALVLHSDGTVRTKEPMDTKYLYNLAIDVISDFSVLNEIGIKRMYECIRPDGITYDRNMLKCLLLLLGVDPGVVDSVIDDIINGKDNLFEKFGIRAKQKKTGIKTVQVTTIRPMELFQNDGR